MADTALISIYIGGIMTFFMALFHSGFYRIFKWEDEFRRIRELNSNIFYTIHIALLLIFFSFSFLTLIYAEELSSCTGISVAINLLLSLFWIWRTAWQVYYFRPSGKMKHSLLHYILTVYFALLSFSYIVPLILKLFLS